ncbi:hypothetical protein INT48_008799 [Thamnidium elegans]|uniref:Uncharacterized protein n=1 Tax=Thamnidium elegans TaxID=101142 RepID=A0A8H7VQY8_9FUNG|nr:hypothetical protein INT48_008799 [Thamnidium elegans]
MLVHFTSIAATISLLVATVSAKGQIAQVIDANNFCVFLPPSDSTNRIIADTEWNANAFCLGNNPLATGAEKLASGFIKSAHYVKTDTYVQVTGQMDYTKENLVGTDGGGQMDVRAPMGSSCAGWKFYVNLIEPESNTYCMRCCNDDRTCNRGISEKGCAHIIPGDYSGPNGNTGGVVVTTTTIATAKSSSVVPSSLTTTLSKSSSVISSPIPTPTNNSVKPPTVDKPTGDVTIQNNENGVSSNKPLGMVIGAGILVSAVMFA